MAGSSNLLIMQTAVNRFAQVAGFSPITTDGGMGAQTAAATAKALGFAGRTNACNGSRCVPAAIALPAGELLTAIISSTGAYDQTRIMQLNTDITVRLNAAADAIGLPHTAPIQTPPTNGGGFPTNIPVLSPMMQPGGFMQVTIDKFKALPTWQKAAIGIASAVAVIVGVNKFKTRRAASA